MVIVNRCCPTKCIDKLSKLKAENERLRNALSKIALYCNDRHRVMMLGVQGFNVIDEIAKAALREVDGEDD